MVEDAGGGGVEAEFLVREGKGVHAAFVFDFLLPFFVEREAEADGACVSALDNLRDVFVRLTDSRGILGTASGTGRDQSNPEPSCEVPVH